MNVKKEIELYSPEADKVALLWLFERYHMQSQWMLMAHCHHHRYGPMSYETRRIWVPSSLGWKIYTAEKLVTALEFYAQEENWKEVDTGIGASPAEANDYGAAAREALEILHRPPSPLPSPEWRYDKDQRMYVRIDNPQPTSS